MKFSVVLVCSLHLVLSQESISECPSLDADKLARLKSLVVKEEVHSQLVGTLRDVWGSKILFNEDPNTCIKYSRQVVNDKELVQSVHVRGKWFGGEQTRNSSLKKVENGVYLEVLHNVPNVGDFVLAKAYVLYSKNNVFAYFWCMMYAPPPDKKEATLTSLSGVVVHPQDPSKPQDSNVEASVQEAVQKVQENQDILGEIVQFTSSC